MGSGREHVGEATARGCPQRRRHGGELEPGGEAEEGETTPARNGRDFFLLVLQGQRQHTHYGTPSGALRLRSRASDFCKCRALY